MKRLFFLTITLGLFSCGSPPLAPPTDAGRFDAGTPSSDGGSKHDGGPNFVEACQSLNLNRCAYFIRCGLVEDTSVGRDACLRELEANWCGPLTWPPHVTAGALRYDAVKADTCATAFATWSCDEFTDLPESCGAFLKPRSTLGEACFDGFTECSEGVCRGNVCPRTCQARAFADAPCTADLECRSGLFCKKSPFNPSTGLCSNFGTNGSGCERTAECLIGLECVNQQCRLLPATGDACLLGRCSDAAFCDDTNMDGGVCVTRKGETAQCTGDQCQNVLVCDALDNRCLRREVSSGDSCSPSQACPLNETCVGVTTRTSGMCHAPLEQGEKCVTSSDCQAHLVCLGEDGGLSCQPRKMNGSSCASDRECFASAKCSGQRCVEKGLPSESCSPTLPCRWGLCRETADGGGMCGSLLGAGIACQRPEQCASGYCDNGLCLGRCLP